MTKPRRSATKSSLAALFPSMAMARMVVFFAVHPGARYHMRELKRLTGLSSASLQHELKRLAQVGALVREDEGPRTYFRADESHRSWYAWMVLLRASARPTDVLREALVDAPGLEGAFVFGSTARGDARPDSDVDIFLIGSLEARNNAACPLVEAEFLIGREIDVIGYDREQLAARIRSNNAFVQRVLAEPRVWLHSSDEMLPLPRAA